ncbi:MAG: F0F1 ATP synthase subunit gamma [Brachymonas sp.]|nr:F0F1 ATP synthase subunit gamma [Brachymonas sp.]
MAVGKEIRGKIKSVENTRKITKAMEMVAASKMRKAQERMRAARPYAEKVREIAANLGRANPEYVHPFMQTNDAKSVGMIVITSDKGLAGGLNTNILRAVTSKIRELQGEGLSTKTVAIGNKGLGFLNRMGAPVLSHVVQLGDTPRLDKLIGPVKVLLDAYAKGEVREVYLCYTRFVNTMTQEPVVERLLPLARHDIEGDKAPAAKPVATATEGEERGHVPSSKRTGWSYIYEPDAQAVIDDLLVRYVESLIYQSVAENMASEQSARTVAMKAASDNAKHVIDEFKLIYNKTRQAAITKELSEIVAGAAAV